MSPKPTSWAKKFFVKIRHLFTERILRGFHNLLNGEDRSFVGFLLILTGFVSFVFAGIDFMYSTNGWLNFTYYGAFAWNIGTIVATLLLTLSLIVLSCGILLISLLSSKK
jgi:hypothetical protein